MVLAYTAGILNEQEGLEMWYSLTVLKQKHLTFGLPFIVKVCENSDIVKPDTSFW